MEGQIFEISGSYMESFVLNGNEIWISQNKIRNLEKFEKAVLNTGMLKNSYSIPLDKVSNCSKIFISYLWFQKRWDAK